MKLEDLKKFFPVLPTPDDANSLIKPILVYIGISIVAGFVLGVLAAIPFVGILFTVLGSVVGLYTLAGLVMTVLVYTKTIK